MPIYENRKAREKEAKIAGWVASPPEVATKLGLDPKDIAAFERALVGTLAVPGDAAYKADETKWNPAFDDPPALIAFCEVEADVRYCLAFARKHALAFTCRAGGHSTAGYCLVDGGLVIDVSRMDDVYVEPGSRRAVVGSGTSFHKLNAVLNDYDLHVPGGGCSDVCVGGYMQGGGYGFTSRMFGLNSDNVLEVRVMLADGTVIVANTAEHQDLFWAVRGGTGNNFGVLLTITYQLHELASVWVFGIRWEMEEAALALHGLQKGFMGGNESRKLGYQGVLAADEHGVQHFLARGMVNGDEKAGRAEIAGMLAIGNADLQVQGSGTYLEWNEGLLANIPPITPTRDGYALKEDKFSTYIGRVLEVDEWSRVIDYFKTSPDPGNAVGMEIYGGAINAYQRSASAFIHRDVHMDFFCDSFWFNPDNEERAKTWLRGFRDLMRELWNGHSYQNYPQRGEEDYRWMYWGEAFNSLLSVKKRYDPDDFFRYAQSVSPYPEGSDIQRATEPSMFPSD